VTAREQPAPETAAVMMVRLMKLWRKVNGKIFFTFGGHPI
jgi:hypothetical protein